MLAVLTICRWFDAFNKCNIESLTAVLAVFATRYYTTIRFGIPPFRSISLYYAFTDSANVVATNEQW